MARTRLTNGQRIRPRVSAPAVTAGAPAAAKPRRQPLKPSGRKGSIRYGPGARNRFSIAKPRRAPGVQSRRRKSGSTFSILD